MIGRSTNTSGGTVDHRPALVGLVDMGLIAGLVALGRVEHGYPILAVSTLETMVPFLAGWLAIAFVADVYADDVLGSPSMGARVTAVAWLAAANVGLILRSSPFFDGTGVWPFNLVITVLGTVVLLTWRIGYAWFSVRDRARP